MPKKIDKKTENKIIKRLKEPGNCREIGREFGYKSGKPINRIMYKAAKDGRLPKRYIKLSRGKTQEQYDKIIEIIKRKQKKGEQINFEQIASQSNTNLARGSVESCYKTAREQGIIKDNRINKKEANKLFNSFPVYIRKDFNKLSGKDKQLFMNFLRNNPGYFTNYEKSTGKIQRINKRKALQNFIFRAGSSNIANEIATEFVENYFANRFNINYKLGNFLGKWNGEKITKGISNKNYNRIRHRIRTYTQKEGVTLTDCFISLLSKDLRPQMEDILNNKRLAKDAATEFVLIYDKKSPDGEIYGLSDTFSLTNFLYFWDVNKKRFNSGYKKEYGDYYTFLSRILKASPSHKQEDYIPAFLNMLVNPLRKKVEDIITGDRLRQDLRKCNLEEAVANYLTNAY